jgi:phospholipid/cholesterol/gamma-HCH transport system ATP-binding protein
MRQRLGIARAIALNPEIIFYDDPTAGLDPINSDNMGDLILDLKNKHKSTVILVTHSMFLAYKMAGRIALVADQSVIVTGTKDETINHSDPRVQQFIHGYLNGPLKPT